MKRNVCFYFTGINYSHSFLGQPFCWTYYKYILRFARLLYYLRGPWTVAYDIHPYHIHKHSSTDVLVHSTFTFMHTIEPTRMPLPSTMDDDGKRNDSILFVFNRRIENVSKAYSVDIIAWPLLDDRFIRFTVALFITLLLLTAQCLLVNGYYYFLCSFRKIVRNILDT